MDGGLDDHPARPNMSGTLYCQTCVKNLSLPSRDICESCLNKVTTPQAPMSPEREQEIRAIVKESHSYYPKSTIYELLCALDAARVELEKCNCAAFQEGAAEWESEAIAAKKERDALREEVETWKSRAEINGNRGFELQEQRDALRAENAKLKDCELLLLELNSRVFPGAIDTVDSLLLLRRERNELRAEMENWKKSCLQETKDASDARLEIARLKANDGRTGFCILCENAAREVERLKAELANLLDISSKTNTDMRAGVFVPMKEFIRVEEENAKLREALSRFKSLGKAVFNDYPDETIIRCEVTAGDIRAVLKALAADGEGD